MYENVTREELAKLFLPKNQNQLNALTLEELNEITKKLLCCDVIEKEPCVERGNHSDMCCIYSKYHEFFSIYRKYASIFDFCRTIGADNIYDIGCCFINQSFLLHDYPEVTYTGISLGGFTLADYRNVVDETYPNYHFPCYDKVPDFCGGRISFAIGEYPFVNIPYSKNNIALGIHSIGTYRMGLNSGPSIEDIAKGLARDFDRVFMDIYNKDYKNPYEYLDLWKGYMPEFEFYKVMSDFSQSVIFATKCPEDIEKLRSDESYSIKPVPAWQVRDYRIYDFNICNRHKWEGHPTEKVICAECASMMD